MSLLLALGWALALAGCSDGGHPPWPFGGEPPGVTTSGGWWHAPIADLPARAFSPPPRAAWGEVACTLRSDPEEVHVVAAAGAEIALYGLLPDEDYDCVLTSDRGAVEATFRTDPPPAWLGATWTVTGSTTGYTLFNHGTDDRTARQAKLVIVDPEGRLRWAHFVGDRPADLDAAVLDGGVVLYGGGFSIRPRLVDLAGIVRIEGPAPSTGGVYHHEVGRLDDGGVLALASLQHALGEQTWAGASLELLDPALGTTRSLWTTQRGLDEGWLAVPGPLEGDPYHVNAASFVPELDGWLVSLRAASKVVLLDRATGDLRWELGLGGDFALVDDQGAPLPAADWFFGQHAPEMQKDRILMHDNGWGRPGGSSSRIVEYALDEDDMTARLVWQFTEEGWYEPIWGDVDRLPDGHVLVTRGHCGSCLPDDPDTTQLVEFDPDTGEVVWRLVLDTIHDAGYRAQRVDGCALFANRKYCDDGR